MNKPAQTKIVPATGPNIDCALSSKPRSGMPGMSAGNSAKAVIARGERCALRLTKSATACGLSVFTALQPPETILPTAGMKNTARAHKISTATSVTVLISANFLSSSLFFPIFQARVLNRQPKHNMKHRSSLLFQIRANELPSLHILNGYP